MLVCSGRSRAMLSSQRALCIAERSMLACVGQCKAFLTALFPQHWTVHDSGAMLLCRCAYTNWTTTARGCDDFFTDPNTIQLYKNHVQKVLTRVNTVNHIAYQNDSTILGDCPEPLLCTRSCESVIPGCTLLLGTTRPSRCFGNACSIMAERTASAALAL